MRLMRNQSMEADLLLCRSKLKNPFSLKVPPPIVENSEQIWYGLCRGNNQFV